MSVGACASLRALSRAPGSGAASRSFGCRKRTTASFARRAQSTTARAAAGASSIKLLVPLAARCNSSYTAARTMARCRSAGKINLQVFNFRIIFACRARARIFVAFRAA